jgi:hypothetical protein
MADRTQIGPIQAIVVDLVSFSTQQLGEMPDQGENQNKLLLMRRIGEVDRRGVDEYNSYPPFQVSR